MLVQISNDFSKYRFADSEKWKKIEFPEACQTHDYKKSFTISYILAEHRKKGHPLEADLEAHDTFYQVSALILPTQQIKEDYTNYFLAANIHIKGHEIARDCAEANAINEAAQLIGVKDLQLSEIWVMGGRKKKGNDNSNYIKEDEYKRVTPCGSCRDVILKTRLQHGKDTLIHSIPCNNGDKVIIPGNKILEENKLSKNQIFTRTVKDIFPHVTMLIAKENNLAKFNSLHASKEYFDRPVLHSNWLIRNIQICASAIYSAIFSEKHIYINNLMSKEAILQKINKKLHEIIKKEKGKSALPPLHNASVAIIRTTKGKYKFGIHYEDGRAMAVPSEVFTAIANAGREKITDVFYLDINFTKLNKLDENTTKFELDLPNGNTRDRIRKASYQENDRLIKYFDGSIYDSTKGPNVHIFIPNDLKRFDRNTHVKTFSMAELLPNAFIGQKSLAR